MFAQVVPYPAVKFRNVLASSEELEVDDDD